MTDWLPTPHHMNNLKIRFKEPDIQTLHHILDACSLEVVYLTRDENENCVIIDPIGGCTLSEIGP